MVLYECVDKEYGEEKCYLQKIIYRLLDKR